MPMPVEDTCVQDPNVYFDKLHEVWVNPPRSPLENIKSFRRFRGTAEGEWVELQVLEARGINPDYPPNMFAYVDHWSKVHDLVMGAEYEFEAQGIYYVLNEIHPLVHLRAPAAQWNRAKKGSGTTDTDISSRRAAMIDFDPVRPVKGISASDEESACAVEAAIRCYADLAAELGSDNYLAFGFSGNGAQVYVALDSLPNDEATATLIRGLLMMMKCLYSSDHVEVDTSVGDAKRLCPVFGSTKRKGVPSPDRPHRQTWFYCQDNVRRLTLDQLKELVET